MNIKKYKLVCESANKTIEGTFYGTEYEILKQMDAQECFNYEDFYYNNEELFEDTDEDAIDIYLAKYGNTEEVIVDLIRDYGSGYYRTWIELTEDDDEYYIV